MDPAKAVVKSHNFPARRPTLERQSSIEKLPVGVIDHATVDGISQIVKLEVAQSTPTRSSPSLSSHRTLSSATQSTDDDNVFGLPKTPRVNSFDSQDSFFQSPIIDKSSSIAGPIQMSKAGRKRKHPMKPGKHICQYCGRACAKPSVLEKHIRMHTGERPFPCNVCDLSFKTKSNLYKHRKSAAHTQKNQERGLSFESTHGESFGSSRDESMDMADTEPAGHEDCNQPHHAAASHSQSGSLDGQQFNPRISLGGRVVASYDQTAAMPSLTYQPEKLILWTSYFETTRRLEVVDDTVDSYADRMGMVVYRRAHWLLDGDCIVSIQLQNKTQPFETTEADKETPKKENQEASEQSPESEDVKMETDTLAATDEPIQINPDTISESTPSSDTPRSRMLSRQDSVASPAANMFFSSDVPSTVEQLESPERNEDETDSPPDILKMAQSLDSEQLLKRVRKIISSDANIHSNVKLLLHKHCMEIKLKLLIPDISQRRAQNTLLGQSYNSFDISTENAGSKPAKIFKCRQCSALFAREHIRDIHTAFYCPPECLRATQLSSSCHRLPAMPHSFDELPLSDERMRMKLLKTGSEDSSYTYLIADEQQCQQRFARSKSDMPLTDKRMLLQQPPHSSTDTASNDGVTAKQQLKNHVLKHMSHGSLGSDAASAHGSPQRSHSGSVDLSLLEKTKQSTTIKHSDSITNPSYPSQTVTATTADGRDSPKAALMVPRSGPVGVHLSSSENAVIPPSSGKHVNTLSPYCANPTLTYQHGENLLRTNQNLIIPVIVGGGLNVSSNMQSMYRVPSTCPDIPSSSLPHDATFRANSRVDIARSIIDHSVVLASGTTTAQAQSEQIHVSGSNKSPMLLAGKHDFPSPIVSQGLKPAQTSMDGNSIAVIPRPSVPLAITAVTVAVQRYIYPTFDSMAPNNNSQSLTYLRSSLQPTRVTLSKISPLALSPAVVKSTISPLTLPSASVPSAPTEKRLEKHPVRSVTPELLDRSNSRNLPADFPIGQAYKLDRQNSKIQVVLPADTAANAKGNTEVEPERKLILCMSPKVRVRDPALASPNLYSQPDHQRISLKRRRFSQNRSQSSVSFDDSVLISEAPTGSGPSSQTSTNAVVILSAPKGKGILRVTESNSKPVTVSDATRLPPTSQLARVSISTINSVSNNHPITYQLYLSQQTQRSTSEYFNHRADVLLNRKAWTECRTSYQTVHRQVPSHSVLSTGQSNYCVWVPSNAPLMPSPWIDMSVAMSCYNSKQSSSVEKYAIGAMDSRSIFTHSSYWQYKNKMRVMQPMPSQMSITQLTSSVSVSTPTGADVVKSEHVPTVSTTSVPQVTSTSPIDIPTAVAELAKNEDAQAALVNNNNRPSVITRDIQHKKKIFHRSQSTPNAGGDTQSKLIAGGFKSDEDYVYVRGRGKGKYVCQQCGIRCRKPSMLKKHIRTHTDLRPYSCKHCNFSFKTKGNLTKHMRSKAHHRRCLELNIVPVPSTVDDSQIDKDILASQQKLSRESKIKGAKMSAGDDRESTATGMSDASDDDLSDDEEDDNSSDDESSVDDALHIDEDAEGQADSMSVTDDLSPTLPPNSALLRRVQSMPAHHMANSFDASSLAAIIPDEPMPTQPLPSITVEAPPPPKKRKKNHLNLTITTANPDMVSRSGGAHSSTNIEDDIARSLLDLSQTPVHGTPTAKPQFRPVNDLTKIDSLIGALKATTAGMYDNTEAATTPRSPAVTFADDVKRVSVVRSTKQPVSTVPTAYSVPAAEDNEEPMDLRVQSKPVELKFICRLCRAICNNQSNLDSHMKLHDGPVIEVDNRSTKRLLSHSHSFGSFDKDVGSASTKQSVIGKLQTPQTPNLLRRQHAVSMFDSDAEDEEVDHQIKVEPGEKLSEIVLKRKCPYCPKIFLNESYVPHHIKSQHLITQEYVCTYKDCGKKFTNMQDLTYHLGTHALDDNDKYQPISVPKCGVCEKTFKSIGSLKQHIQHHSETRTHVCEYCDAGFTTAQSLKHHLKTHTQERPYVCGECGSTFARSDHLTQHSKTHKKNTLAHPGIGDTTVYSRNSLDHPTILNPAGNSTSSQHHQILR